jgi:S-(hydroxymethyl)glutathione dehydrogenase / alcohol dehydrogenase
MRSRRRNWPTRTAALAAVRAGGAVTLIGVPAKLDETYRIDNAALVILAEKHIQGCAYGSSHPQRDIPRYLAMARTGLLDPDAMITARRPLDEVATAFEDLEAGRGLRTVIDL